MNHIKGSAIRITCTVDYETGTTAYLTIFDPNGTEVLSAFPMSSTTNPASSFVKIWQSSISNTIGAYKAIVKTVNGIYENKARHQFFLEDE